MVGYRASFRKLATLLASGLLVSLAAGTAGAPVVADDVDCARCVDRGAIASRVITTAKLAPDTITDDKPDVAFPLAGARIPVEECGTIDQPGSYLVVTDLPNNEPLNAEGGCLAITADDVTLDLGGFSLVGNGVGNEILGDGITMDNRSNVTIGNGTLRNFGDDGIGARNTRGLTEGLRVIDVRAIGNRDNGIRLEGRNNAVLNCLASDNGSDGIATGMGSTITGNRVSNNGDDGIETGSGSAITGNTAQDNGWFGIRMANSLVDGNTATGNGAANIAACADCTFGSNHAPGLDISGSAQPASFAPYLGGYAMTEGTRERLMMEGMDHKLLQRISRMHVVLGEGGLQLEPAGFAHNSLTAVGQHTFVSEWPKGKIRFRLLAGEREARSFEAKYDDWRYELEREQAPMPPPWPPAAPDTLDRERLDEALELIRSGRLQDVHSILILRRGQLVHEEYLNGSSATHAHQMRSVTKSVASLLVGIAVDRGLLREEERMADILPEHVSMVDTTRKAPMTVRHVLNMRTGLDWKQWGYPFNQWTNNEMKGAKDWVGFILNRPLAHAPGAVFNYSDGDALLVSGVLDARTGTTTSDFAKEHLFDPLGIDTAYWWSGDSVGHAATAYGLNLAARDLAKLGEMMNGGGKWADRDIVSDSYIKRALQPVSEKVSGMWNYGYYWWQIDLSEPATRVYAARGLGNQELLMVPEFGLVVVLTAWNLSQDGPIERFLTEAIVPIALGQRGRLNTLEDATSSPLTGQHLRSTFAGVGYEFDDRFGNDLYANFGADGTMTLAKGTPDAIEDRGRWWLSEDRFCRRWSKLQGASEDCFHVVRTDDGLEFYNEDNGLLRFSID